MLINIKTAITKKDKKYCLFIRKEVFVREQRIPKKIEFDDKKCILYFMKHKINL